MRQNYSFSKNGNALLEPCEGKLSCTVLRGESPSNGADLLDTQKEIADAIGFLFETFVDDDTLTDMQKEATFNEGIRYSQKLFKDLIADMGE